MVLVLLLIFIITQWSSTLYLPLIPEIVTLFSHPSLISASVSGFFLGYAFGQLFWGILSDYFGRYRTLIIALCSYLIFQACVFFSSHAVTFVIFLSMTGFAVAANTAIGNALIKDTYSAARARIMIGYVGIAMSSGPVVAPLISAFFYSLGGWRVNTIFLGVMGCVTLFAFSWVFGSHRKTAVTAKPETASLPVMLAETLKDKNFVCCIVVLSSSFGVFFAILLLLPFVLASADLSVNQIAYVMFAVSASGILGTVLNGFFFRKKPLTLTLGVGLALILFALSLLLFNRFFFPLISWFNFVMLGLVMLGVGIVLPASKAGAMLTRTRYVGTAASLMKLFQSLGAVVMTRLASYCINNDNTALLLPMLWAVTLLSDSTVILSLSLKRRYLRVLTAIL